MVVCESRYMVAAIGVCAAMVQYALVGTGEAAEQKTQNVILVTLDGLRGEELFGGAEEQLIDEDIGGVRQPQDLRRRYWRDDPIARRQVLMPFFWQVIAREGQVFGDPEAKSTATVKNGLYFSYPGYQEILCGFPDPKIDSNDKNYNENVTVLEWLHQMPDYQHRVAAFASWDVFPYILNVKRSGMLINAGWQDFEHFANPEVASAMSFLARDAPHYWAGVRFDAFTTYGALEYVRRHNPRVLYLSLGETDDWCHDGRYDLYLDAARRADRHIQELWQLVQQIPQYADATSLVITTDHGRGAGREGWKNHSTELPGSERIWMAVIGPDTPGLGVRKNVDVTQGQTAATVAALLGHDFTQHDPKIAPPLPGIVEKAGRQ